MSLGFNVTEVTVNEDEDLHFDVCVTVNGADEIDAVFFVEFELNQGIAS